MKFKTTLKKFFSVIMVCTMILGLMNVLSIKTTIKASENPVKMYCMDYQAQRYGIFQYNVYIQVNTNSAKNKEVYVHHKSSNGWVDTKASYLTRLDDNTEIWQAHICDVCTDEYVIKYIGDGVTYWDNNNGKNYGMSDISGSSNVKAMRYFSYQPYSYIKVSVQNLGYDKTVKVRYTLDNWNTYQDADLSYISSTSGTNEEIWFVDLGLDSNDSDSFHYCIYYEVNGQTYWDNNFGENYDSSYNRGY